MLWRISEEDMLRWTYYMLSRICLPTLLVNLKDYIAGRMIEASEERLEDG